MPRTFNEILKHNPALSLIKPPRTKLLGRDNETQLLIETFYKKRMNNAILLGKAGVGKTAIVENFAKLTKDKYYVCEYSIALSVSKTKYRGEFEDKITKCFRDIAEHNSADFEKKIIVFIDEIHTIYKAGASEGSALDAANILKPFLSKGEIMLIGATTIDEYKAWLASDTALIRRITPIYINELGEEVVLKILEKFGDGVIKKPLIKYIYSQSLNFKKFNNPDISIEILDRCMARSICQNIEITNQVVDDIVNDFTVIEEIEKN